MTGLPSAILKEVYKTIKALAALARGGAFAFLRTGKQACRAAKHKSPWLSPKALIVLSS
jgi:hypothetical protein